MLIYTLASIYGIDTQKNGSNEKIVQFFSELSLTSTGTFCF